MRNVVCLAVLLGGAACAPHASSTRNGSSVLPLRTARLYETGVGYFERSGYAVLEAGSGAEALRVVEAGDVDAVVSDVLMPEVNGVAFYDSLVSRVPELLHRVVFLTGAAKDPKVQVPIEQRG